MSLSKVEEEVSVFSNPSIYFYMVSRSFSVGSLDVLPVGSPRSSGLASGVGERVNGPRVVRVFSHLLSFCNIILLFSYLRSSDLEFLSVQFLVFVLRSK